VVMHLSSMLQATWKEKCWCHIMAPQQ